jgi:hypothetical protein
LQLCQIHLDPGHAVPDTSIFGYSQLPVIVLMRLAELSLVKRQVPKIAEQAGNQTMVPQSLGQSQALGI